MVTVKQTFSAIGWTLVRIALTVACTAFLLIGGAFSLVGLVGIGVVGLVGAMLLIVASLVLLPLGAVSMLCEHALEDRKINEQRRKLQAR